MRIIKLAVFLPQKKHENDHGSIYFPLSNRIPNQEIHKLLGLIHSDRRFEVTEISSFEQLIIVNGDIFYENINLNHLDIFFWYGEIGRGNGIYSLEVLKALSRKVKVIPNPYSFEVGLDKYFSHMALKEKGVNVPDLVLLSSKNVHLVEPILEEWGYGLLKPRKGGFGKGVTLINSFPMLRDMIEYMESFNVVGACEGILLERYYKNNLSDFVSTTIVDGKIMYGYCKRLSKVTDLGNGYQKIYDCNEIGGEVDLCEVLPAHEKQALLASDALGLEIIGFDMIWHEGKPIIIDENTFPGMYLDLFQQQNISLSEKIYNLILRNSPLESIVSNLEENLEVGLLNKNS